MTGAASLAASGAMRAGAGYVQLATPGVKGGGGVPTEAVALPLAASGWQQDALAGLEKCRCLLIGPGLGRSHQHEILALADAPVPLVVDGDALVPEMLALLRSRDASTVITPHDGEWRRLGGSGASDRIGATRDFAIAHGVTVMRKGPTTIVADPTGEVLIVDNGGPVLATAGTGDVLAGVVAALLALGLAPLRAGSVAAFVHARAAQLAGPGLVAGDLPVHLPAAMTKVPT